MRAAVTDPARASSLGAAARRRMVARYSPPRIAEALLRELRRVEGVIDAKAALAAAADRAAGPPASA
jgi:hypothetical protein